MRLFLVTRMIDGAPVQLKIMAPNAAKASRAADDAQLARTARDRKARRAA